MQFNADTSLIEAARRIGPVIHKHKEEAERERRLSQPVLAALHQAGLLRMFTPRSLGGTEVGERPADRLGRGPSSYPSVTASVIALRIFLLQPTPEGRKILRGCYLKSGPG